MKPLETFNVAALFACALATVSFGFDRLWNHKLPIGGGFFLVLGAVGMTLALAQVWMLVRDAWRK